MFGFKNRYKELENKLDALASLIEAPKEDKQEPDKGSILDDVVFERMVLDAKSKAEIDALRSKRNYLKHIKNASIARESRQWKPNKAVPDNGDMEDEDLEDEGSDFNIENARKKYFDLPGPVRGAVDSWTADAFGVKISDLLTHPEAIGGLIKKFAQKKETPKSEPEKKEVVI